MALTKEQTKYFVERLNQIVYKKNTEASRSPEDTFEIKQARELIRVYDSAIYKGKVALQEKIKQEKTSLLDMLHFGEQTELIEALKAFDEKDFSI